MGLYSDTSLALLCKQIARDNPDAPQLTKDGIIVLDGPTTVIQGNRNTTVALNGKAGAGFSGRRTFLYNRLNLGVIFQGIAVTCEVSSVATRLSDLIPVINDKYGLGLTDEDVLNGDDVLKSGLKPTEVDIVINTRKSLAYVGELKVTWSRVSAGIYPESGPGTKRLAVGDLTEGYFGLVSQSEMLSSTNVYELLQDTHPGAFTPAVNSDLQWIKFALDGDFYFFPISTLGSNISWDDLQNMGCVKGDNPAPWVGVANDNSVVVFQMALPLASSDDPMGPVRNTTGSLSERIFNKLHTGAYGSGEWDDVKPDLSTMFLWLNHYGTDVKTNVFYSQLNQAYLGSVSETSDGKWRPLLKIVKGNVLLAPFNVRSTIVDRPATPLTLISSNRPDDILTAMKDVAGRADLVAEPPTRLQATAYPIFSPADIASSNVVEPVYFKVSIDRTVKVDLEGLDGELLTF